MSSGERVEIGYLLTKGYSARAIAHALVRGKSSIADELARNRVDGTYDPRKAHHKAYVRRKYATYQGKKIVEHLPLRKEVDMRLMDDQSPEAIAKRITRHERHLPSISKDAVYRYIASPYGRRIEAHRSLKKQPRKGGRTTIAHLSNRTFIDKRPKKINMRVGMGHMEADFIVSGKSGTGILLTACDRKARVTFIEQILRVTIEHIHHAFLQIKQRFPEMKTVTTDNDILFAHHEELAKLLRITIYFCHPYHSWEKGTIENTNGVIRRDIPKGSDVSRYTKPFIQKLEDKLNRRPMKCLEYRTPQEVLNRHRVRIRKQKTPR